MLTQISISQLRSYMVVGTNILCGAGVSMIEPTGLPSGNQLRDLCVRGLLLDKDNGCIIDSLLGERGYQRLLPEAVLQDVGLFASRHVDTLVAKIIAKSPPNAIHHKVASQFPLIFTTNFDLCFEAAGARKVVHLHGAIDDLGSLQNRVFRLGKGRDQDIALFESDIKSRPLLVVGYSLRDEDVLESLSRARPDPILFLSYDGEAPPFLLRTKSASFVARGEASKLFDASGPVRRRSHRCLDLSVRKPSIGARAAALLFLIYLAGRYELASDILRIYLPRLTGRTRYKAMCSAADSLRIVDRYDECVELCRRVVRSRFCRRPDQVDQLVTAHNLLALCILDRGGKDTDGAEFHFREALRWLREYSTNNLNPNNAVGIDIFRARIINNIGLFHLGREDFSRAIRFFLRSRKIKLVHHDDRGVAQTDSNLAKCYMRKGDYLKAFGSLREVGGRMRKSPDRYICKDAVGELLPLLAIIAGLNLDCINNDAWAILDKSIAPEEPMLRGILLELNELDRLHRELYDVSYSGE